MNNPQAIKILLNRCDYIHQPDFQLLESPCIMPATNFYLNLSSGRAKPRKENPSPLYTEGGGIVGLCGTPKAVYPTRLIEWLEDISLSSIRYPLFKAVGGAATQCTTSMDQEPKPVGTYTCYGYVPEDSSGSNPTGLASIRICKNK